MKPADPFVAAHVVVPGTLGLALVTFDPSCSMFFPGQNLISGQMAVSAYLQVLQPVRTFGLLARVFFGWEGTPSSKSIVG